MTIDINALLKDEQALRLAIARVLTPGPWKHTNILGTTETIRHTSWDKFTEESDPSGFHRTYGKDEIVHACGKCGCEMGEQLEYPKDSTCTAPDPPTEPMEVLVRRLVEKAVEIGDREQMGGWYIRITNVLEERELELADEQFAWWLMATPAEQAVCLLAAMEGAKP